MLEIIAFPAAIVKPAIDLPAPVALIAADEMGDDSWLMSDDEADRLAAEADAYAMYEAGHPAW